MQSMYSAALADWSKIIMGEWFVQIIAIALRSNLARSGSPL